jgi:hypothetical protein
MVTQIDRETGYRWPVAVERTIEVPAQEVWAAISRPGNLELCHPFCASNPVRVWPGDIGRSGGATSAVSWRIRPIDDQSCALKITVYPHVLQNVPVVIRWLPHLFRLAPMLRRYLKSVIGGFDWYLRSGEPVPRDHFGRHPWFSASKSATDRNWHSGRELKSDFEHLGSLAAIILSTEGTLRRHGKHRGLN